MSTLTTKSKHNRSHAHTGESYDILMKLSSQITAARERAGMNQSELARACGVSPGAINKLEAGDTKALSGDLLLRLSLATNSDPFEFSAISNATTAATIQRLIRVRQLFSKLPKDKQVKMLHYLSVEVAELEAGFSEGLLDGRMLDASQSVKPRRET